MTLTSPVVTDRKYVEKKNRQNQTEKRIITSANCLLTAK